MLGKLVSRASLPASYLTAGILGSFIVNKQAEQARAYYGDIEYTNRFRGAFDFISSISKTAGYTAAIAGVLGVDPISSINKRIPNYDKYKVAKSQFSYWSRRDKQFWDPVDIKRTGLMPRSTMQKYAKDAKSRMKRYSPYKLGIGSRMMIGGAAIAGAGLATISNPAAMIGTSAGVSALMAAPFLYRNRAGVGLGMGALAAGGYFGYSRPMHPAAEGSIVGLDYNKQSTVDKMNYSTAGLVQSLHKNRKVF